VELVRGCLAEGSYKEERDSETKSDGEEKSVTRFTLPEEGQIWVSRRLGNWAGNVDVSVWPAD
jgi:hypothetical protein